MAADKALCSNCVNGRPNGVCTLTLSTEKDVCIKYEHDPDEKTCKCGWWSCPGRGCGDCPSCYGEYCECGGREPQKGGEYEYNQTVYCQYTVYGIGVGLSICNEAIGSKL